MSLHAGLRARCCPGWPRLSTAAACRLLAVLLLALGAAGVPAGAAIYNVRDFGATGRKEDDARPAIQRAIDACAQAAGGTVLIPPGDYTSGTLHLRSHLRIEIAAGATLFAAKNPAEYSYKTISAQAALFFGEELEDVAIEGAGTIDGQAEYDWREDDFERGFKHKETMMALGKPLLRPFPKGFPKRQVFPRLVWIGRSRNLRFTGLRWLHSPSWSINLYGCEHARFDRLFIHTSLQEGVWADGIDLDGCQDVSIERCHIETGDDCIIFISSTSWGPAIPCENIVVKNCQLSSASAGVKFSEGNVAGVRHVRVTDCLLTNVNRGFVFSTTLGGEISDVVLSNLTIHCRRFDWFWAGDGEPFFFRVTRLSEFNQEAAKPGERPPGSIRDIVIRNVAARAQGTLRFHGHAEKWIDGLQLENVRLTMSADPSAPFDYARHAVDIRRAANVRLRGVAVAWGEPSFPGWQSACAVEDARDLVLEGFSGRGAPLARSPALAFRNVSQARVTGARAVEGTTVFLQVLGERSSDLRIENTDLRHAATAVEVGEGATTNAITVLGGIPARDRVTAGAGPRRSD